MQLYRNASVGLVPVRSEQVASYPAFLFNTLFSRESPPAIPAKIGARGAMGLVACHLHPRSGTSPTEDFGVKAQICGTKKLYLLLAPVCYFSDPSNPRLPLKRLITHPYLDTLQAPSRNRIRNGLPLKPKITMISAC